MKKTIASLMFAAILILGTAACGNKENKTENGNNNASAVESAPDKKTEISVGPDGAEVKTKSGTEVKVGDKGASVGNKDVDIKVGTTKDDNK